MVIQVSCIYDTPYTDITIMNFIYEYILRLEK